MRIIVSALLFWYFGSVFPVWAEPEEIDTNGCRECHRLSSKEKKSDKGPDLFYAGDKFYKNWLNKFLQSPTVFREVNVLSESDFLGGGNKASNPHVALVKEGAERVANFLNAMTMEMSLLTRSLGKGDVHSLEPEDLAALTIEASAMAQVPLVGTNKIFGQS